TLDTDVLEKEKDIVLDEMRLGEDSPRRRLGLQLYAQLFEGHPYGRRVIGTPELVRGLTRETLAGFYRRHYVPETFAVVAEGAGAVTVTAELLPANVDRAEAEVLAEIRRVRDTGVTEAELRRAITAAEAEHEFETETAEGRARALGTAETIWTLEDELAYVNRIRSVTAVQV